MPICHSDMTVDALPVPLSFLQSLDARQDDFASKLMAALATHLGFPREPRIPYREMTTEVQRALSEIAEHSEHSSEEGELGFLDHLESMDERIGELAGFLAAFGEESTEATIEINKFVGQVDRIKASGSEVSPRDLRRIARKFGERMGPYAQKNRNFKQEL